MEEFLTNYYSFLIKLFEIIAALTGVLLYKKYKNTPVKYFIWILVAIAFIELVGSYTFYVEDFEFLHPVRDFLKGTVFEENNWFYTIFWKLGATIAFAFYFIHLIEKVIFKNLIKIVVFLFLICAITTIVKTSMTFL